jgi:hypothetical protein
VLEPGTFAVYEKRRTKKKKDEWILVESGTTGISFIPIVTFYANRNGFVMSKPPLEDLAHLNIRHWQSMSDQINILTVVRFPMLAVAGATEQGGSVMRIGPRQLLSTRDPNGRFYYVEHKGESIEAGWNEIEGLEERMESYGAQFLKKDPGNETATGRALDSAEAMSPLKDMVIRFIDSVNNAMAVHAEWLNLDEGGTVKITTDFAVGDIDKEYADLIFKLRDKRDISRLAYIKEMKRVGVISENYDPDADFEQMIEEDKKLKPLQPQVPGTFDPKAKTATDAPRTGAITEEPEPRSEDN